MGRRIGNLLEQEAIRIEVISDSKWIAMTAGFWKPSIILSTGIIAQFSDEELRAILYHELYHYKFRHPLQLIGLTIIAKCLAFLPVVKGLVQYYKVWLELLADRYAIGRTGSEVPLALVLLKMLKQNPSSSSHPYGVHLAQQSVNYRLQQLIDPQQKICIPFVEWKTILPSATILMLMKAVFLVGCIK